MKKGCTWRARGGTMEQDEGKGKKNMASYKIATRNHVLVAMPHSPLPWRCRLLSGPCSPSLTDANHRSPRLHWSAGRAFPDLLQFGPIDTGSNKQKLRRPRRSTPQQLELQHPQHLGLVLETLPHVSTETSLELRRLPRAHSPFEPPRTSKGSTALRRRGRKAASPPAARR